MSRAARPCATGLLADARRRARRPGRRLPGHRRPPALRGAARARHRASGLVVHRGLDLEGRCRRVHARRRSRNRAGWSACPPSSGPRSLQGQANCVPRPSRGWCRWSSSRSAYAALAALFLFVYRFFYGGEVTFAQSLAVVAWSFAGLRPGDDAAHPARHGAARTTGTWTRDSALQASVAALLDKATTSEAALRAGREPRPLLVLAHGPAVDRATARSSASRPAAAAWASWCLWARLRAGQGRAGRPLLSAAPALLRPAGPVRWLFCRPHRCAPSSAG